MTPRRILLSTDAVGGVWTYTIDLARALEAIGVQPVIAAMGPSPNKKQYTQAAGIHVFDTGLPLDWLAEDSHQIRNAGRSLAHLVDDVAADVVQLHSAALACDVRFNRPLVAVQHSCVATWWDAVRGGEAPEAVEVLE